jgi:hypothetical protein
MGFTQEDLGIEIPLMSKWFDIDTQQWQQNTSNFAMLMPVYVKGDENVKQKQRVVITQMVHKSLLKDCFLRSRIYSGENVKNS